MKRKRSSWICPSFAISVALMISLLAISAADSTVGVEIGDWVKYEVTGTVPYLEEYAWVKLEVQSVSGSEITVAATVHFRDGREEVNTLSWDIETGREVWIMPADLSKGDAFQFAYTTRIINDTVTRVYAGKSRTVNLLNLTRYDAYTEMIAYWDQTTGFLLELFLNKSSPTEQWTGGYRAIETNIWYPTLQVTAELSSYTTAQGETVTITAAVKDEDDRPIEGATVNADIDGEILSLSDLGDGNYEGALETTDLAVGTYTITITAEKSGYESTQTSHTLIVETPRLKVAMQLATDTITRGDVVVISATVEDAAGNPVEGAVVTVYIGEIAVDFTDMGNGNYEVAIDTSDIKEGTYTVTVATHKEAYEPDETSQTLTIEMPRLQVDMQLSTDTATRGDVMTISAVVNDNLDNPIGGATVTAYIGDTAVDLSDTGNGNYQLTLDTSDLSEGTYIVTTAAHKEGYESGQASENLTVKTPPAEPPWPLYGGIGAIAVVIIAAVFYLVKRRS